jgi:crotonobetainyl-CoA:carnitine CoA-transferase CaiB-like acyl-CoA transferase
MLRAMTTSADQRPLSGIRVIEVADESATYGTRLLADLGAEVVMVEPSGGSTIRRLAPFADHRNDGEHGYEHLLLNANKRSVRLDLDDAEGQRRFLDLIATADVLVDGGPSDVLPPALADEVLRRVRPNLLRVSVRPYGLEGPWAERTGNHLTALASGGLLWLTGDPADPPTQGPVDCAYKLTGHSVATAVMMGLHARDRDGTGAHFHISAQEAVIFSVTQTANGNMYTQRGHVPHRPGLTNALRCADGGWAGLNVRNDRFANFLKLITAAGVEHDLTEDDWQRGAAGPSSLDSYNARLGGQYAATLPRDEFVANMRAAGQVVMPNYNMEDVASEPHYRDSEQFVEVSGAATGGTLSMPRSPIGDLGTPVELRPAPRLGEADALLEGLPAAEQREPAPLMSDAGKLLEGLRVIELTWVLAGPISGRMLADHGAEVIRVESRVRPDGLRNALLADGTRNPALPGLWNCANTGKRSLTLDLTQEPAKELLRDVIATADLVINNYALGSFDRMGLDYASLSKRNPGLIMIHMPGCGTRGRWAPERTLGNLLMAASGINSLMGFEGRDPRGVGIAYPDFIAPHMMVTLALAAVRERERTGQGREFTINQLGATVSLLGAAWMRYAHEGTLAPKPGNRSLNASPHGVFPTTGEDRWIALAARTDQEWSALAGAIGRPELATDARFASFEARKANEDELEALIEAWTANQDRWELAERLQALGIPAAAVENLEDTVTHDPQLASYYQMKRQPSAPELEILVDSEPIRLLGGKHELERAPALGEHSEYVLREILGLSMEEFDQLVLDGIVN